MMDELSDQELLEISMEHLAESLCALYETQGKEYQALAFMVDSCVKLGTVLKNGDRILDASSNWEEYERECYEKHKKLKVIK